MAIAAYFHPKNMTLTQFNEIHRRLEKAGAEPDPPPPPLLFRGKMAT
jgi:hypothetical protein